MSEGRIRSIAERLRRLKVEPPPLASDEERRLIHEAKLAVFLVRAKGWRDDAIQLIEQLRPELADVLRGQLLDLMGRRSIDARALSDAFAPCLPLTDTEAVLIDEFERLHPFKRGEKKA